MARTEWDAQRSVLAVGAFLFFMEITMAGTLLKMKANNAGWRFRINGKLLVEVDPETSTGASHVAGNPMKGTIRRQGETLDEEITLGDALSFSYGSLEPHSFRCMNLHDGFVLAMVVGGC